MCNSDNRLYLDSITVSFVAVLDRMTDRTAVDMLLTYNTPVKRLQGCVIGREGFLAVRITIPVAYAALHVEGQFIIETESIKHN